VVAQSGESPNQRSVVDLVRRDDAEKAGRMRYLYEVDIVDPNLYDLVVNTERLKCEPVVEMLERAVCRPEMATTEGSAARSRALPPASRCPRHASGHPPVPGDGEADAGVVTLEGRRLIRRRWRDGAGGRRSRPSRWTSRPSRPRGVGVGRHKLHAICAGAPATPGRLDLRRRKEGPTVRLAVAHDLQRDHRPTSASGEPLEMVVVLDGIPANPTITSLAPRGGRALCT
jgi:hypothetical protein